MRKEDEAKLFAQLEEQGKKIDLIYQVLAGDELGQSAGLILEQKKDNEFRHFVKDKLNVITINQNDQIDINKEVHARLEAIEVFVKFFNTIGQVKRKTWMIIGALMAGIGYMMMKLEVVAKWFHH